MFKKRLFKKSVAGLAVLSLILALGACSGKEEDTADNQPTKSEAVDDTAKKDDTDKKATEKDTKDEDTKDETVEEEDKTEEEAKDETEELKPNESGFTTYHNEEYLFKMDFPKDWEEPREEINEKGLTVLSSTDNFSESIIAVVRALPEGATTIQEYQQQSIDTLKANYGVEDFNVEEIITINGVDYLKLSAINDEVKMVQLCYIGFSGDKSYEIATTVSLDYYEINKEMFDAIENSIKIE